MTEDPLRSAIWSRAAEKTNKLALLFACSRSEGEDWPVIRLEDADRAIRLNNWLTRRMLWAADKHVANSEHERAVNRFRALFRERPGQPWTLTELSRRTRQWTKKQRMEILQTLLDGGYIVAQEVQTSTRPATVYVEVEQDEDP
jgi:hypothetical protein